MNIFTPRPLTEFERSAIADEARPGVWIETAILLDGDEVASQPGDGRQLSQQDTDNLIVRELIADAVFGAPDTYDELVAVTGGPQPAPAIDRERGVYVGEQRGGIHSEPLVRLLAFRALGDRDRTWRKRDTVRVLIGPVASFGDREVNDACRRVYGLDEVVTYSVVDGIELKARRAERAATALINQRDLSSADSSVELIERLLNAYDEIDVRLAAGGEPLELAVPNS